MVIEDFMVVIVEMVVRVVVWIINTGIERESLYLYLDFHYGTASRLTEPRGYFALGAPS
jgi:hypothetical protein